MLSAKVLPKIQGKYKKNINLGQLCWFKTTGFAEVLYIPSDIMDLENFLNNLNKTRIETSIYVIGAGSNLLVRDKGLEGIVIRLGSGFNYINHYKSLVTVGASVLDYHIAKYALKNSISGLEFLSGIPGTIGGGVKMNAGAYGYNISDILVSAKAINIFSGIKRVFRNHDFGYYYRGNALKDEWLFYEATLRGYPGNKIEIESSMQEIQKSRLFSQPINSKTGGSTFKNPINEQAWRLIDGCGLRGKKVGKAKFSELHPNFLINEGGASASDLEALIKIAKQSVKKKYGVLLEEEIKIIGNE